MISEKMNQLIKDISEQDITEELILDFMDLEHTINKKL